MELILAISRRKSARSAMTGASVTPPATGPPAHSLLQFQRNFGNHVVQEPCRKVIHLKLAIGRPGEPEERDRMAEPALRAPDNRETGAPCLCLFSGGELWEEYREKQNRVQRRATGPVPRPPATASDLVWFHGPPLDLPTRTSFEPRFGADFSCVRVHEGPEAAASARAINALAFTAGENVVFGAGRYSPHSAADWRLLAHELAHVVQQAAGPSSSVHHQVPAELNTNYGLKEIKIVMTLV